MDARPSSAGAGAPRLNAGPAVTSASKIICNAKPIAAPIVGGMVTSTIHVLILVPVFITMMKESPRRRGTLRHSQVDAETDSD